MKTLNNILSIFLITCLLPVFSISQELDDIIEKHIKAHGGMKEYNAIENVKVTGLENSKYIDEMDENKIKAEEDPITINKEVDRIYCGTDSDCIIIDKETGREIINKKSGSNSTVVWNPWINKSKRMSYFGDNEYKTMICVETTNAHDDARVIKPGEEHRLAATISVKKK